MMTGKIKNLHVNPTNSCIEVANKGTSGSNAIQLDSNAMDSFYIDKGNLLDLSKILTENKGSKKEIKFNL